MTEQLIKRLESYRKQNKLTRYALCKLLGVYPLTYRRWKESGNITKAYKRLITNFLSQKYPSTSGGPEGKKTDPRSLCSDIAVIGIGCYYPGLPVFVNYGRTLSQEECSLEGCLIKGFL